MPEATTDSRKTLYTGIAVTVLLAVAVGIAAVRADSPAETPKSPRPTKSATPERDLSVAPTATPDATGAPVAPEFPGQPPVGAPTAPQSPGAPGSTPARPSEPVKQGDKLTDLKTPPDRTIGMIVVPEGFTSGRFTVTFSPFGWGPAGPQGGRLVAEITKSAPLDDEAKSLDRDFAGRNATLWCSDAISAKIKVGGTYTGVIEVRRTGDTGTLTLVEVVAD